MLRSFPLDKKVVRIDGDLYLLMQKYEEDSGVSVTRSVNEAVRIFAECIIPPRVEFIKSQRIGTVIGRKTDPKEKSYVRSTYQNETKAAG